MALAIIGASVDSSRRYDCDGEAAVIPVDDGSTLVAADGEVEDYAVRIRPAKIVGDPLKADDLFRQMMAYLLETHKLVEPLYKLEQERKLSADSADLKTGREFLEAQLVRGGQMLGDLWFSAWQQATEDRYLIARLKERQALNAEKK